MSRPPPLWNVATSALPTTPFTRERLALFALLAIAAAGIVLTLLIAGPFIPGLTWALAFAVVGDPIHRWLAGKVKSPELAAALAVLTVALLLVTPATFIAWNVGAQATASIGQVQEQLASGDWEKSLQRDPSLRQWYQRISRAINIREEVRNLSQSIQRRAGEWMQTAVWGVMQMLIALFALFYFWRDRKEVLRSIRSFLPFSDRESDYFFERIHAMTHATIYGTLTVAAVQGALGGLMFWWLEISGALLWGVVMGLLAIIPVLGAFVIWAPVAVYLATQGRWWDAATLTVWGTLVVGLIDNLLYPILVGKQMRLHTLPVFIAIVGGLFVFGAAGLVLGPLILASTVVIIEILKFRTLDGSSAEEKIN